MTTNGEIYDEAYYLRGKETGKSLYENYRWMPDLTLPMVAKMISHCGIKADHSILDFGCARGYTVRAFREMGYDAWGHDVSQWAIENCDPLVKDRIIVNGPSHYTNTFDWVIAKDVLEHVQMVGSVINDLLSWARVGLFVVVPLSLTDFLPYVVQEYEMDVTHVHRLTLASWVRAFVRPGWSVTASYRVPGVKDNYAKYEYGNGFITCRRLNQSHTTSSAPA